MANIFNTIYELVEKSGFQYDDAFREYNVFPTLGICTLFIILIGSLSFRLFVLPKKNKNFRDIKTYRIVMGITVFLCGLICFILPNKLTGIFIFSNALWLFGINIIMSLIIYRILNIFLKFPFLTTDFIPTRRFSKGWFEDMYKKIFK